MRPKGNEPGWGIAGRVFEALLVDLDGSLIDSRASVDRAWSALARKENLGSDFCFTGHGRPARQVLAELVPPADLDRTTALIERLEVDDAHTVVALHGAVTLAQALPLDRWAIVTSCTRRLATARQAAAGLRSPRVLITVDEVIHGKPAAEPYLRAAGRLDVDPTRCLVIEDAPAGLASGRAAGCATLALTTTHVLDQLDADAWLPDLGAAIDTVSESGISVSRGPLR